MYDPHEPLDLQTTLTTLMEEFDYQDYGYRLPRNAPQVMACLIARYFDLDSGALALTAISLLEYIVGDVGPRNSGEFEAGPGNTTPWQEDT
jgi:hypothetical protein